MPLNGIDHRFQRFSMLYSVQLEPLLEIELEQAARRLGVSPSQFIVSAVEQALAQAKHDGLSLQPSRQGGILTESSEHLSATKLAIRSKLKAQRVSNQDDWLAYQEAKKQGRQWVPTASQQTVGDFKNGMYDLVSTRKGSAP
jgi:RHH-type rel operon transcriptional repressor/antitoxin RelB